MSGWRLRAPGRLPPGWLELTKWVNVGCVTAGYRYLKNAANHVAMPGLRRFIALSQTKVELCSVRGGPKRF